MGVRRWGHARTSTKLSLAFLTCAALLAYVAYDSNAYRQELAHGYTTEDTIVGFHNCSPCGRWDSNYYIIEVPVAGRTVRTSLEDWSWRGARPPGFIVQVRYAAKDPAYYVQDAGLPLGSGGRKEGLGAAALMVIAVETWRSQRSRTWKRVGAALDRFAGINQ